MKKKNGHRNSSDHRKDQNRASPVPQSHERLVVEIESHIEAMGQVSCHRQDNPIRRSARLGAETQRAVTHLRRQSDQINSVTIMCSVIAPTSLWESHRSKTGTT